MSAVQKAFTFLSGFGCDLWSSSTFLPCWVHLVLGGTHRKLNKFVVLKLYMLHLVTNFQIGWGVNFFFPLFQLCKSFWDEFIYFLKSVGTLYCDIRGERYLVELVKVRTSWSGYPNYGKKKEEKGLICQ